MERQVGTGGHIEFHGSGFYHNDYKDAIKKEDIGPAKKKE
jgi:predicted nucleic acid-binding Zn ribbon protein